MALSHRRQPVGVVLLGIALGADSEEAPIEQADGARQHALAGDGPLAQVALHPCAELRQRPREFRHGVELLAVATLAPAVVVAVLLPSARVDSGRLNVPERIGTDPDVLPARRNREGPDALEGVLVVDPLAALVHILEPPPPLPAGDSRCRAVASSQARHDPRLPAGGDGQTARDAGSALVGRPRGVAPLHAEPTERPALGDEIRDPPRVLAG